MLFNAGDQVPVMPFVEVDGKGDSRSPEQIGETAAKVGVLLVMLSTTVTQTVSVQPCESVITTQ